jgi:hypothetical protein
MTIQDLMLLMTLNSLKAQDATFETLFRECEERTKQLNSISSIMQILGKYREYFDKDGKPVKNYHNDGKNDKVWIELKDRDALVAAGFWDLVKGGVVPGLENIGSYVMTKGQLDTVMDNLKLTQGQVSSINEQQMMRANQAANKRSTIMQFGQSLLQSIKEANQSGAR